jgi:hypothetical protein
MDIFRPWAANLCVAAYGYARGDSIEVKIPSAASPDPVDAGPERSGRWTPGFQRRLRGHGASGSGRLLKRSNPC